MLGPWMNLSTFHFKLQDLIVRNVTAVERLQLSLWDHTHNWGHLLHSVYRMNNKTRYNSYLMIIRCVCSVVTCLKFNFLFLVIKLKILMLFAHSERLRIFGCAWMQWFKSKREKRIRVLCRFESSAHFESHESVGKCEREKIPS